VKTYVASGLGFSAAGQHYYRHLLAQLHARGIDVLDPWADEDGAIAAQLEAGAGSQERLTELNRYLGERNQRLIEMADAVLAVLDGSDIDSGTAAEVGYAAAKAIPVVGVRSDFRLAGDNAATPINLQVLHFILLSGGSLHSDLEEAVQGLLAHGRD
jgi:nucleoside 2-deoxyribosyltransferase